MLSEIFKALLITSLAGSCLAAVITFAKPITKKVFGYYWHYYIWLAVLFAMILPVRFTLPQKADIPPITAMQTVQTEQTEQTTVTTNADNAVPLTQEKPNMLKSGTAFVQKIIDNRLNILALLWLIGTAVLLLINLIGYIRLIIKMRKNSVVVSCPELMNFTDKRVTVRVWENTSSPFMTGIFKPTLVLPAREFTEEQLNNILRHEMTHFKRHDILYKWFVSLVKCVHWFNPVIWYVSKQVNTECEISCDMAVTQNMNKSEEMSYIDTVLALLPMGKTKQIPLTTQMASSKKTLKRRFTMIRNKKKTSKIMSVISAVIATAMLGTTVFASGVLSDLAADNYTIEITNNGEKIELANKPFIENGEVYVPLREILTNTGVMEEEESYIHWDEGKIEISIAAITNAYITSESAGNSSSVKFIVQYGFEIGDKEIVLNPSGTTIESMGDNISYTLANPPILRNGNTYIPYEFTNYIFAGFDVELGYTVFDKTGDIIKALPDYLIWNDVTVVKTSQYANNTPEYAIDQFFYLFGDRDFGNMKRYCTEKCINTFLVTDIVSV